MIEDDTWVFLNGILIDGQILASGILPNQDGVLIFSTMVKLHFLQLVWWK